MVHDRRDRRVGAGWLAGPQAYGGWRALRVMVQWCSSVTKYFAVAAETPLMMRISGEEIT